MFSKSKRFDNNSVGCGADAVYNPKDMVKPIGGVIPKVDRFADLKSNGSVKSDTESVHSDKSPLFRTPKSVKRVALSSKKQTGLKFDRSLSTDSFTKDILNSKNVEIRNKDELIIEHEQHIRELKETMRTLNEDITKYKCENEKLELNKNTAECNYKELLEDLALVKSHHSLALEANESIRHEYKMETDSLKLKHEEELASLEKHFKSVIESLKTQHLSDIGQISRDFSDKIKYMEEDFSVQVQHTEEDCFEKIKICQQMFDNNINQNKLQHINEIEELKLNITMVNKEKNKFSLTLDTTLKAFQALETRLRRSDEDVGKFKLEVEELTAAKIAAENELAQVTDDLHNFRSEYNQLLFSIINSKTLLDESHKAILEKNLQFKETLISMEAEFVGDIENIKKELEKDIYVFKQQTLNQVKELEKKVLHEHNLYLTMKSQCDEAFEVINNCQHIIYCAKCQLENVNQELNELATENDRLSGTLAAVEQEKNELQILMNEFKNLLQEKDRKLHDYNNELSDHKEKAFSLEERLKKMSQFLEATEFIVKEKDTEINKLLNNVNKLTINNNKFDVLQNELSHFRDLNTNLESERNELSLMCIKLEQKCNYLEDECSVLREKIEYGERLSNNQNEKIYTLEREVSEAKIHLKSCNTNLLQLRCKNLEQDLEDITTKYTNLLGHQNTKQKIKHMEDLKTQNSILKEETRKQASIIEKLTKNSSNEIKIKSQLSTKKQLKCLSTPLGKENITSPMGKSPKILGSPKTKERPLTPLKDLNC